MIKRPWGIFLILIFLLGAGIGWAAGELDIKAPGGGEMDLKQNMMKYFGLDSRPVEVRWNESIPGTGQLSNSPLSRVLKAFEVYVNFNRDYLAANKEVTVRYDKNTTATADFLEWDRRAALMKLSGQAMVIYKDWTIKGSRIEGQIDKEFFTVYGPVEATNKINTVRGGKLTFDRGAEKVIVEDDPILIHGNSEMTASEIIYLLNTNQVSANGTVKTRIINENN